MPDAKTPDVMIDGKEAETLLAVLSRAAEFCEGHGADRDMVKRLKAVIDRLKADRDTAVGRAASLRNHLSDFSKGGRGQGWDRRWRTTARLSVTPCLYRAQPPFFC
jgi:hypothetical protein